MHTKYVFMLALGATVVKAFTIDADPPVPGEWHTEIIRDGDVWQGFYFRTFNEAFEIMSEVVLLSQNMDHYAKTFDIFKKSLTPERRQKELDLLLFSRWRLRTNRDGVQEDYRFRTFKEAFKFMSREAEKMDQQPE